MTCGECGRTVTAEIKKGKYIYYRCIGYGNKHKPVYVPERKIDRMMAEIVSKVTLPVEFYEFLSEAFEAEFGKQRIRVASEKERLELERDKIQNRMRKAYQDRLDGVVDEVFLKDVYEEYRRQLDAMEYRLASLPEEIGHNIQSAKKAIELSYQAESHYLRATPDQKRRLLKSVLSNCYLEGVTLCPVYKNTFDIIAKGAESNKKRG